MTSPYNLFYWIDNSKDIGNLRDTEKARTVCQEFIKLAGHKMAVLIHRKDFEEKPLPFHDLFENYAEVYDF